MTLDTIEAMSRDEQVSESHRTAFRAMRQVQAARNDILDSVLYKQSYDARSYLGEIVRHLNKACDAIANDIPDEIVFEMTA